MNLIAAVDSNWAIGNKNELLVRIPDDQRRFREMTTGKVVILGRKTLETFPNKRPLKNRTNIVITRDMNYKADGAVVVHSIEEAVEAAKGFADDDIYVIGGESVYRQMLPFCDTAYITRIEYSYRADAYFPALDKETGWTITDRSDECTYFDLIYEYVKYERERYDR